MHIFAYMHPYTPAKSTNDLIGYWFKVHESFVRRRRIIVDVKATIGVRYSHRMLNVNAQNEDGVC